MFKTVKELIKGQPGVELEAAAVAARAAEAELAAAWAGRAAAEAAGVV